MKEEILKRAMFAMPLSKEARNSGILSGFDMDEMEEMPEPSEEMPQMARTPQNPEILMNNLRGDMRSVDARYMELAQMVGEEAAMETPPEVLAMLQMQLGQQPAAAQGIGALPQAQGMMPPGAMPAPEPQGGMPAGMGGGMPPFPQGGAEEAPPTPDGMPPMKAALGAFITPATRLAQMGADKLSGANAAIGQMMSRGFPQQFPAIFENLRGPGGRYIAEQTLKYPTFTEHLANKVGPTVTAAAQRFAPGTPAVLGGTGVLAGLGLTRGSEQQDPERAALLKQYEDAYYGVRDRSIPMPSLTGVSNEQLRQQIAEMPMTYAPPVSTAAPAAAPTRAAAPGPAAPAEAPAASEDPLGDFIKDRLAAKEKAPAAAVEAETPAAAVKSRMERIKEAKAEYAPLYKELLGDTKDEMYTNAMLMLADAGFKYAAMSPKSGTTPLTMLASAASGLPQGFMALLAQAKDRQLKVDTAALSQAISDVQEQDKYAQQLKLEILKGDYKLLQENAKKGGAILEDGGAGLLVSKGKDGSFLGTSINPNSPTVQSAVSSRWTLRDTDNPFVVNRGEAPTTVETDKSERTKLTSTLRSLDNSLSTLDNLKGTYTQVYGPGAWLSDKVNNLLVPVLPTAVVRPDVNLTDAATRISTGMNTILKNIASANDGGRVAVQEQEWARDTAKGISDPTKFFSDKELAAKQFASMESMLRNARQQVLTQLGYEKNDYVMSTPATGTKTDPFVVPTDPDQQKRMFNFLGSTIGKIQDPRAMVFLKLPNGAVQSFNPTQLQGLLQ